MMLQEKILMFACLFGGFLWLRGRSRAANLENQMGRALLGVFVLLPALLAGEKYLLEQVHFGAYTDMLIKALAIVATFSAIGLFFIRLEPKERPNPSADQSAS